MPQCCASCYDWCVYMLMSCLLLLSEVLCWILEKQSADGEMLTLVGSMNLQSGHPHQ